MPELTSIPEFYRNKTVFITGGSGFIGKVLVEKLLRSCPDLKTIYLLMREKKGRTPKERIKTITDLPLFDLLKSQNPDSLNKIETVAGDVRKLDLGLNLQQQQLLIDEVNIVFHIAASVRFDDDLTDAVIINTRGTREVAKLGLMMKNVDVLVHVSTTYCHCDRRVVEEKLYPPHGDWQKTIQIAENVDRDILNLVTKKQIHPLPNTYTFTKSLSENVVSDMCGGKIPVVIYRPSIVLSTAHEPLQGWIDNFNGPIGLLTACGKGLVRTVYSDPNIKADYVPVDLTVKAMIMSSWKQGICTDKTQKPTLAVYNGSSNEMSNVTFSQIVDLGKKICVEAPLDNILWYPNTAVTKYYYYYFFKMLIYHLLPALIIDGFLKLTGQKPTLMKIQKRIYVSNMALSYFTFNQWNFVHDNSYNLGKELVASDIPSFSYRYDEIDVYDYFFNCSIGVRKYLLKEGDDLENAKKHSRRMWILANFCNVLWYLMIIWLVFVKIDIISIVNRNTSFSSFK